MRRQPGLLGFSSMDDRYIWSGFDVDICRAVSAAIFGDPARVTFVPLDAAAGFAALQTNRIDLLSRNSTWTLSPESLLGLMSAGIAYYDGQGFAAPRRRIDTALQLGGKTVCPDRHHQRTEPVGLFPRQRHGAESPGARYRRREPEGL